MRVSETISEVKENPAARINPIRIGLVIVLGVLTLYIGLLWRRTERLERELIQVRSEQVALQTENDGIEGEIRALRHRLPIDQFSFEPQESKAPGSKPR